MAVISAVVLIRTDIDCANDSGDVVCWITMKTVVLEWHVLRERYCTGSCYFDYGIVGMAIYVIIVVVMLAVVYWGTLNGLYYDGVYLISLCFGTNVFCMNGCNFGYYLLV